MESLIICYFGMILIMCLMFEKEINIMIQEDVISEIEKIKKDNHVKGKILTFVTVTVFIFIICPILIIISRGDLSADN